MGERIEGSCWYMIPGEKVDGQPVFHCKVCTYTSHSEGAVRLHTAKVHGQGKPKPGVDTPGPKGKAKRKAPKKGRAYRGSDVGLYCPCGGPILLLDSRVASQALAIQAGYTRYCGTCQEVYK